MTIAQILEYGKKNLSNVENPFLETKMIVEKILEVDHAYLIINSKKVIEKNDEEKIKEYINLRQKDVPLAYILKEKNFYGYNFCVEDGVLIPRFDTEILVEKTLKKINSSKKKIRGLEIGVGSGIISISLLKNKASLVMDAVDINQKAIELSRKNAIKMGVSGKINIFYSDLFENVSNEYDFIISNPPYIEKDVINNLDNQIKNYEPLNALDGGEDGLDFYRKIVSQGIKFLKNTGFFAFEIGYNQGEKVENILIQNGFVNTKIHKDLNDYNRVVIGSEF